MAVTGSTVKPIHVARSGARAARLCHLAAAGSLAFGLAAAASPGASAPDGFAAGKPLYDRLCGDCHQIGIGAANGVGPKLNGIIGLPAGVGDYAYSPRMKRSAVVWTPTALDAFIADPQRDMPGTRMAGPGVPSAADRAAIIAYLSRYRADGTVKPPR